MGPPKCEPGQEEGTQVEHFPILGHEGMHIEPEEIDQVLDFHAESLYGVYRRTGQPVVMDQSFTSGAFGLIFTRRGK